ncbi:hypothetical protein PF010_g19019 [Phytophthora fragariae]|uniref:Uncharacterized protein n=1 Tax=Phytophthora fragariae TaxID=53985 RepID=A0A6A3J540_9STRA|nr:hypothetical protein PF011_g18786 [Phytophthora fragariae]KAE9089380.1 hypothetical protein PF010_g19019 [Phytophthora fragariae]KAE9201590.1 hypothetical protein PF004_g18676 [Phytophthora fragariae]
MEGQPDIKIDGVTAFALPLATSYRYAIELKSSKMSIWMEDRISKKQWYKGGMAKTDYVSDANVIPDATVADYVKTSRRNSESTMKWGPTTGADFASTGVDGVVKARRGGTYIIFVTVTTVHGANTPVYLLKNNTSIQVAYPGYSQGNIGSTSLSTIEVLEKNNELTVKCSCKLVDTSYL